MRKGVVSIFSWTVLLGGILSGSAFSQDAQGTPIISGFITKSGTHLLVNGQEFRAVGYNYDWLGSGCSGPSDSQLDTVFAQIHNASKGNIVRVAFFQGGDNASTFTTFDRFVSYAKKYNLYILPILVNEWTNCEPSSTMKYLSWYQSGYTQQNDGYPLSFHDYAVKVAQHYANEPTIAWYQLVNEPDGRNPNNSCSETTAESALFNFAHNMVEAIKQVDHNHMVDLGAISWCGGQGSDFQRVNSGTVDLCDVYHGYKTGSLPFPPQLQSRLAACKALNKPSFIGEVGICAEGVTTTGQCPGGTVTEATLQQRAALFDNNLQTAFNNGVAGYVIWNKNDNPTSKGWSIGTGDPTENILSKYAIGGMISPPGAP